MMDDRDEVCYECTGYGDDYYVNEDGEYVPRCPECPYSDDFSVEEEH